MKLRTNLDKYNYYLNLIKERQEKFVSESINEIPEFLYSCNPNGEIVVKTVTEPYYYNPKAFPKDKPTKVDVSIIKNYFELNEVLLISKIQLPYFEIFCNSKSSSAVYFTEYKDKFLTKEQAELKSIEIKEKIAAENILLENGHSRCQRCRKVYPNNEKVKEKMISIYTFGREGRWMEFCSKTCAMHEQVSLEG